MNSSIGESRNLFETVGELRSELQEFVQTRAELFIQESKEKAATFKTAIPQVLVGVLLLATTAVLFPMTLAALVVTGFGDNPYRWLFAFLIVGILWSIGAATALYALKGRLARLAAMPRTTIQVLDGDKQWLQSEAKHIL
jgi:uncharacterized membrane protein YqjE